MILTFTVPQGADRKVYNVLRRELHVSAALVRRLKKSGGIFVNGEPAFTDRQMHSGDVLTADISGCEPFCDIIPGSGNLRIIYEDEGLIAVNKDAGIIVHPTHSRYTGTLANFVSGYLADHDGCPSVHAVNRLDRDTSGVILFAKNSHLKALASDALSADSAAKEYKAVVLGHMPKPSGVINAPIRRKNEIDMMREVAEVGQDAVTHYDTIATGNYRGYALSLLSLKLDTGRTHQIRVHCAYMGCPVLGDSLYCTPTSAEASAVLGVNAQLLHASLLSFVHPITCQYISLNAPIIRDDMTKVISNLA